MNTLDPALKPVMIIHSGRVAATIWRGRHDDDKPFTVKFARTPHYEPEEKFFSLEDLKDLSAVAAKALSWVEKQEAAVGTPTFPDFHVPQKIRIPSKGRRRASLRAFLTSNPTAEQLSKLPQPPPTIFL